MKPRMAIDKVVPEAYRAVAGLERYVQGAVDHRVLHLVKLRASILTRRWPT